MSTKNLGLAQAVLSSTTAPTNTKMLWYDEDDNILKYYNTTLSSWVSITYGGGQFTWGLGDSDINDQDDLQVELNLKVDKTSISEIDNTSDVNKPVSILQQDALDLKVDKSTISESDKNVYRTIVEVDSTTNYSELEIQIPRKVGAAGFFPNVRITIQYVNSLESEFLFEAIMSSGKSNSIITIIDKMIVGEGRAPSNFVLNTSNNYEAYLVVETGKINSPYNKLFVKLESYDPIGELDLYNSSIIEDDSFDTPIPTPIFTV